MSEYEQTKGWNPVCKGCGARSSPAGLTCDNCGCLKSDETGTLYLAPRLRRLSAYLIDVIGLGIVSFLLVILFSPEQIEEADEQMEPVTSNLDNFLITVAVLAVALLAWSWTARTGQSPGMRLLGLFVYRSCGKTATVGRMMARDLWPFALSTAAALVALVGGETDYSWDQWFGAVVFAVLVLSGAWVLLQIDRRALHDFVFDTIVLERRKQILGTTELYH